MEELISVIVPVYNGEKYIRKCVESIVSSTYPELEILLINDGSKDHSLAVCKELSEQLSSAHRNIKVFSKENEGIAKTRTFGIRNATGKYVCFADQDDMVYPDSYRLLQENMETFQSDLCIGGFCELRGKRKRIHLATDVNRVIEGKEKEEYIFKICHSFLGTGYDRSMETFLYGAPVWNCIYKKELIEKHQLRFQNFVSYEDDFLFNLDYLMHASKVSFEKEIVYPWVQNVRSESHNPRYIPDYFQKNEAFFQYITEHLKRLEHIKSKIDFEKWEKCFLEKNLVDAVVNEAKPENKKKNKDAILYLENIYHQVQEAGCDFSNQYLPRIIIRMPFYLTHKYCKQGKIKHAYYMNQYLYNYFLNKITYVLKIIYFKIG